jgi:putative transposase
MRGVYLKAYESVSHAWGTIAGYPAWYKQKPPHSSVEDSTPNEAYFAPLPAMEMAA